MTKESCSNTDNSTYKLLYQEDSQLKKLKTENTKLKGEISLLRQNMLTLEKSNYHLRLEKSEISKVNLLNSKKNEIELLKIQYKINENKPSVFKRNNNDNTINIKWALKHSNSDLNFKLEPFEYSRLFFFKDYFYNDFYQFDTKIIFKYIDDFSKEKYKKFLDYFVLFACKIDIFNAFFHLVFINDHFIDKKISLFNDVPIDWIIKNQESLPLLREFIDKHSDKMVYFMYRVVSERPFITNLLIDIPVFSKMIKIGENPVQNNQIKFLKDKVCENKGLNLIDRQNIHLFSKDQLKMIYKDDFMDIL